MLKLAGAAMLTAASALTGMYFSAAPGEKAARLYKIRALLAEIMTLLRYRALTVYELADELRDAYSGLGFMQAVCAKLERGREFYPVWERAVLEDAKLSEEERSLLISAGATLGSCDAQGQISALEVCVRRLDGMISAALEDKRRKTPLYRGLGLLAGLFVSVLLM